MKNVLEIHQLHIALTTRSGKREIVHGVDLQIGHGEALALVGESGSGKSITAQAILQLLAPQVHITSGSILFEGEDLLQKTPEEMRQIRGSKVGMIFQDPMTSLNPTMTIGKQVAEVLMLHQRLPYAIAKQETIDLLRLVQIEKPVERFDAYPFQLSGGMRQRVLIAMAIACKPILLIADEPTTALDATIQAQIINLLRSLKKTFNMSLLFITHDLAVAAALCDRAAVMYQGEIVEEGPIDILFSNPTHTYTKDLLIPY